MLSPMDHPTDFFMIVPTYVALMTIHSLEILSDGNSSWTLGNRKHCTPSDLLARIFSLSSPNDSTTREILRLSRDFGTQYNGLFADRGGSAPWPPRKQNFTCRSSPTSRMWIFPSRKTGKRWKTL